MATGKLPAKRPASAGSGIAKVMPDSTVKTVQLLASARLRARAWRDVTIPAAGAAALCYLASGGEMDPLGPLGPGWGAGAWDSPWRLLVATTGGAAFLMHQRSEPARSARERRKITKVFARLGVRESPSATHPNGRLPEIKMPVITPAGSRVVVQIPAGAHEQVMSNLIPFLRRSLGPVTMRAIPPPPTAVQRMTATVRAKTPGLSAPTTDDLAAFGWVELSFRRRDTLAKPLASAWPVVVPGADGLVPARRWYDPIPVALDEDGELAEVSLAKRPSILVAGESGSGKSVFTHLVVGGSVLDPRTQLLLWDGKGELELNRYRPLARGLVGPDVEAAFRQLLLAKAEMDRREELLRELGLEEAPLGDPRFPLLLLVIEEFTAYRGHPEFLALLLYLLVRVRVVNMRILLTVQRPSAKTVPTDIRDNIGMRVAHSVTTTDTSDMILGDGWSKLGFNARDIPMDDKGTYAGTNLLLTDGSAGPRRTRTWWASPGVRSLVVARALELRGVTPDLPGVPKLVALPEEPAEPVSAAAVAIATECRPSVPGTDGLPPADSPLIPGRIDKADAQRNRDGYSKRRNRPRSDRRRLSAVPTGEE